MNSIALISRSYRYNETWDAKKNYIANDDNMEIKIVNPVHENVVIMISINNSIIILKNKK